MNFSLEFLLTHNIERARRVAFSDIVESFAGVSARILREKFGNDEFVDVGFAQVFEIFTRLDFFIIMEPYDIEFV